MAEVVVVGGGIVGLSTAYHLAEAGVRDVVLVERGALGEGSTGKAAGGVRALFSDEVNITLGLRSLETFERFAAVFGQDIDLCRVGYLFLLDSDELGETFERSIPLQNALGVPSRMIGVEEARRLSPLISTDGLRCAVWSPDGGHCTPDSVVLGYASAARRLGVTIVTGCEVTGITSVDGAISTVHTTRGPVTTSSVVCTSGAWAQPMGAWVGVDLPVAPLRREIAVTEPVEGLDPQTPFTIDFSSSFYFHREGPGLLMGMSDREDSWGLDPVRSPGWLDELAEAMARRVPRLGDVGIRSGWAGLYEMTPDHNAVIGEAPDVSRFLYATGFSGHGFLMGPAVGEVMRDLYLGDEPSVDVSGLSAGRFDASATRPELNIV